jgi:deoxyribonuclease-4
MLFGAHVSIAKGIWNAPANAAAIGCEVFQMFTRSPQGGSVPLLNEEIAARFKDECKKYNQKEWYVHAPYFINFASSNPRIRHGSPTIIRQELERSSLLEAKYLMAHLGSFKDAGKEEGLIEVIKGLKTTLEGYEGSTQLLIELSAGAGAAIGSTFEELAEIIYHPDLEKFDIGVCYDTAHTFANSYDIRSPEMVEQTFKRFDKILGLKKLKMFHCNDSKIEFGGKKDRHEHIGEGYIGLEGFEALLSYKKLMKINFIAETEHDKIEQDLTTLKNIRNKTNKNALG